MKLTIFLNVLCVMFKSSDYVTIDLVLKLVTADSRYTVMTCQDSNTLKIRGSKADLYELIYNITCEVTDTEIVVE